ncbi:hypothetical protein Pcinc_040944 [Petrolisthes cinctipes]|uniref:Uncharacterized protein n=1 Tax=Petrolisthes cinctipes TaxID=88211 RepID=A0AAE1BKV8_PETCI|nr:hypothetical protein Pcinc_040944 [Petrolisthes cinctipes]
MIPANVPKSLPSSPSPNHYDFYQQGTSRHSQHSHLTLISPRIRKERKVTCIHSDTQTHAEVVFTISATDFYQQGTSCHSQHSQFTLISSRIREQRKEGA